MVGPVYLRLAITSGPLGSQQWLVRDEPEILIGRGRNADISLPHDSVSRRHARITKSGNSYLIEDLGSQNWTFVNDQRVLAPTALVSGDRVAVGEVELRVDLVPIAEPGPGTPTPEGTTMMVEMSDPALLAPEPLPVVSFSPSVAYRVPSDSPTAARSPCPHRGDLPSPVAEPEPVPDDHEPLPEAAPAMVVQVEAEPYHDVAEAPVEGPAPDVAADQTVAVQAPVAVRQVTGNAALGDLVQAAAQITSYLQWLEQRLGAALAAFDEAGGQETLQAVVEQAQRTRANPLDLRELMGLAQMSDVIIRLLNAQQQTLNLLHPSALDVAGEELESDGSHHEAVVGPQ